MSHAATERPFLALRIAVLTISDTRTVHTDTSGQYLQQVLQQAGHILAAQALVKDDIYQIRAQVSAWIADTQVQVILLTGGTGFSGRDSTPEAVTVLFDKYIEGFGELFRYFSAMEIGTSTLQSRAVAGLANRTAIFCMPGSTGACRTAWINILQPQLDNRTLPCSVVAHVEYRASCAHRA